MDVSEKNSNQHQKKRNERKENHKRLKNMLFNLKCNLHNLICFSLLHWCYDFHLFRCCCFLLRKSLDHDVYVCRARLLQVAEESFELLLSENVFTQLDNNENRRRVSISGVNIERMLPVLMKWKFAL
jgi:hypothetical protein